MLKFFTALASVLSLSIAFVTSAGATATPVPGGANAISALSGTVGQTVFNGNLRIQIQEIREATAAETQAVEYPPTPNENQKVMFMRVLLHNGTHDTWFGLVHYSLADKDAVSVDVPTNSVIKPTLNIVQGAAARQTAVFVVDKDFVPTKLIVECSTCAANAGFRPVRFAIASH